MTPKRLHSIFYNSEKFFQKTPNENRVYLIIDVMVCEICKKLRISKVCQRCEKRFCYKHKREYMFKKHCGCCTYWVCDPCHYRSLTARKFSSPETHWLSKLKCPLCRSHLNEFGKCIHCVPTKNVRYLNKYKVWLLNTVLEIRVLSERDVTATWNVLFYKLVEHFFQKRKMFRLHKFIFEWVN